MYDLQTYIYLCNNVVSYSLPLSYVCLYCCIRLIFTKLHAGELTASPAAHPRQLPVIVAQSSSCCDSMTLSRWFGLLSEAKLPGLFRCESILNDIPNSTHSLWSK
ncbi:hypothetical protein AMECASPLE_000361 [Ameca splendens]|uniref:Uncharacterized protein n=1 Tax=Ameca splendens TaxID=208324 RepID=A0ABV0YJW0_9TELE